jgi:UDP-N-acetylmuramate dehydrogenase
LPSGEAPRVPAEQVALAPFSTLGIGGAARWFIRAETVPDVVDAHRWSQEHDVPMFVLGGGSNLVISDDGFAGLVLQVRIGGVAFERQGEDTLVSAGAGEPWDVIVAAAVARGLAGLECLSGIPGSVGGTPIQNVGAYGQEVADAIDQVTVYDRADEAVRALEAAECRFGYRMSRFKKEDAGRFVVCGVSFRLRPGAGSATYPDVVSRLERANVTSPDVASVRAAVLDVRRRKGMVIDAGDPDTRSVGSFFMNPVVTGAQRDAIASSAGDRPPGFATADGHVKIPAAWLIERAGVRKGDVDGRVGISSKHPLALINRGGATARDVLRLAARIKRQVADRFDVSLLPEPSFVGLEGAADLDYLRRIHG